MKSFRIWLVLVIVTVLFVLIGCQEKSKEASEIPSTTNSDINVGEASGNTVSTPAAPEKAVAGNKNVLTVEDIYLRNAEYNNKEVTISGKVVKVSSGIMGSNWLHVQDGTGASGTNDITITTQAEVKVGDEVVASGILAVNKDFGAGYKYPVIIEKATVTVK